jgi:ATP-binding cassette, subfamily B, bacterial
MEKRAAFSRAWGFLNFSPTAKWLALAAGVGSSVLFVGLVLIFGLFLPLLAPEPSSFGSWLGPISERLPSLARSGTGDQNLPPLLRLAGLAVGLTVGWAALGFLTRYLAAIAATEASVRMRRAVYHHAFRLGSLTIRNTGPGEAAGLVARNVEAIYDALVAWLTVTVREPVRLALLLLLAFLTHFWLALIFVTGAVLAWLLGTQLRGMFQAGNVRAAQQGSQHLALLQESLTSLRLVKSYVMEIFNQGRLERQLNGYARAGLHRETSEALRIALASLGLALATIALLFIAGLIVLDNQLSLAGLVFLAVVLGCALLPVRNWLEHRRVIARGEEAAVALVKFLDRPSDISQVVGAEVLPPLARGIEFDNVTLRDPGTNRLLLREVSFSIPAGGRVALVGSDERAKHAAVCLLLRFLDPTSGEIRIDEHNLRWITLESLRKQVGVVLQHNLVFNDTIAANIAGGDKSFKLPQIMDAAKLAHAHQFIHKLPRGYDTPIGDMGQALTVSERFRIALARAVLRNPLVLVIEEPAAHLLDEDTNHFLDDTYGRMLPGRTVIFLPHREKTLQTANPIILLHQGRIFASGEHLALMKDIGLYRHLFYVEFNEFAHQT